MAQLLAVVGARPNFVKVAPVLWGLRDHSQIRTRLLHTGQHYDHDLSGTFLDQLDFPKVDFSLGVGSGSHAEQTAAVMVGTERVLKDGDYAAVLVAGDVNSTLAAALTAAKARVPVIHLEAGLRSGDWDMPEEVNRVLTDRVAALLLCHSTDAVANLANEGIREDRVELIGNTMIDSLYALLPLARRTNVVERLGLHPGRFVLVTLHRPALVDEPERLAAILDVLARLAAVIDVVLPLHPRTRRRLASTRGVEAGAVRLLDPLDYLDFVALEASARLVVTDSGGVQEETSALGVPCLTYRTTTERPVTTRDGTNRLIGMEPEALAQACRAVLAAPFPLDAPSIPLWDGAAGPRASAAIATWLDRRARSCKRQSPARPPERDHLDAVGPKEDLDTGSDEGPAEA